MAKSWPVAGMLAVTGSLFAGCFVAVRHYYQVGLPYYDSVGSYWNMFAIINTTREAGLGAGIRQAALHANSWLQAFFAVVAAPVLPRSPEWLLVLNFGCLLIAQLALFGCSRAAGYSAEKSFATALLPILLPGTLMEWQGGYVDMRRDASMVSLLTATYFLGWKHAWAPRVATGVGLGVVAGLAQWSRGNALPYIAAVLGPVIGVWAFRQGRGHGWRGVAGCWLLPAATFGVLAVPFYLFTLQETLRKYLFGSWALGASAWESLRAFWLVPIRLCVTSRAEVPLLVAGVLGAVGGLLLTGTCRVERAAWRRPRPQQLLWSGLLAMSLVFVLNCVVLGVARSASRIPFFPMIVGMLGCATWTLAGLRMARDAAGWRRWRAGLLSGLALLAVGLGVYRVVRSMPPPAPVARAVVLQVAQDVADQLSGRSVAYLWLEHIHVHDLNFYITQAGRRSVGSSSLLGPGADVEMPPMPDRTVEAQRAAFARGARSREFVVVTEDLAAYEDPRAFFFLFRFGRPVVEEILRDAAMEPIYRFEFGGRRFVVLRNRSRA